MHREVYDLSNLRGTSDQFGAAARGLSRSGSGESRDVWETLAPSIRSTSIRAAARKPETGGENLPFEKGAFKWDIKANPPKTGQRLSYEVGTDSNSKPVALNLETI